MKTHKGSLITGAYIVPGLPHPLLAAEKSPAWMSLRKSFDKVRAEIEASDAEMILYFSTQWLTVLGYLFQADPSPEWTLVAGRTSRVALMYRTRRFFALTLRAALHGDVPLGSFWFGWLATKWTPNGFEGWTTGKKPRAVFAWAALAAPAVVPSEPLPALPAAATASRMEEPTPISRRPGRPSLPPSQRFSVPAPAGDNGEFAKRAA